MDIQLLQSLSEAEQSHRKSFLDLRETANSLEINYGRYFKPYGTQQYYFEKAVKPLLDFGKNKYYCFVRTDALCVGSGVVAMPVSSFNEISGDVFDMSDRLVVSFRDVSKLSNVPHHAQRAMDFITEYVSNFAENLIPDLSAPKELELILERHLAPEYRMHLLELTEHARRSNRPDPELTEFVGEIWLILEPLLAQVKELLGQNKWMVHLVELVYFDLVIETFCDYRVYMYHEQKRTNEERARRREAKRIEERRIQTGEA